MANRTIGASMRKARKSRGVTMDELSAKSGVAVSTIWRAESDNGYPGVLVLTACADVLGISIDEYIGREVRRRL